MTDGSSVEAEGVRISAARAGQGYGDDWEPDGDAWAGIPPPSTPVAGFDEELDAGRRRRLGRIGRREKRSVPTAPALPAPPPDVPPEAPAVVIVAPTARAAPMAGTAPVVTLAGPRRPSSTRLKVQRKRRRRRRTLIACTFITTVCTFVAGVGYVYVHGRLGEIKRLDLASLADDAPGAVMNVLLVGTDNRNGLDGTGTDSSGKDEVQGPSSDTIMILHVDPRQDTAAIVSVPRDLYVPIAGSAPDRVNTAFAAGGADRLVSTIETALGVTINHYVQVDFAGFKDMVDAVGGITLYVPYPVRDTANGLAIDRPGCVSVDGSQALSWARSRQTEFLVNGTWQPDGRAEAGRIERQQDVVRRMTDKALGTGISNPIRLNRLIGVGVRDVTFDAGLSTVDLTDLGRRFSSPDPAKVVLRTLPTNPVQIAGKAVLALQVGEAQPTLDLLNGRPSVPVTTTTVPPAGATTSTVKGATSTTKVPANPASAPTAALNPADVRVRILNGVGSPGAATKAATSLTNLGFTVADKGDAPSIAPKTTIMYGTGQLAKAQLLQSSLVTTAVLKEDATLKAVDVNLVLGGDFTGVKSGVSSGAPASTTTAPVSPFATAAPRTTTAPLPKGVTTPPC